MEITITKDRLDSECIGVKFSLGGKKSTLLLMRPEEFNLNNFDYFLNLLETTINCCLEDK